MLCFLRTIGIPFFLRLVLAVDSPERLNSLRPCMEGHTSTFYFLNLASRLACFSRIFRFQTLTV
jgi:hypothetical protein